MDASDTSSTLSSSESNEYSEHNIWNLMLELLCHTHIGISMEALFDEGDMVRIAFSFHFALDILMRRRNESAYEKKTHPSMTSRTS